MHTDISLPQGTSAGILNGDRIIRRIAIRLIPFLFLLYVVNYIDRANISFTKPAMHKDFGLTELQYGWGAGIFFIGYTLLEVPSNWALQRIGARRWIARIIFSWGVVAAGMALVRGATSFVSLRFLLGAAEAGFMPGMILYLARWFPAKQRAKVYGWFLTSTALSGVIGSPLSRYVLLHMDGLLGLHGWRWVYLLEGLACLPLAVVTFYYLPDEPKDASWLEPAEAEWITEQLAAESAGHGHDIADFWHALRSGRVWILAILYFLLISGLFGFIFWAPSLIKGDITGWITAIPYLVGAIMMVLIGRSSDWLGERRWHVSACAVIGAIGMAASPHFAGSATVIYTLSLAGIGIWGCLGPFWALPTEFLRGDGAAMGIAVVNSIGCTAGFFTPYVIGLMKDKNLGYAGLYFVAALLLAGAVLAQVMPSAAHSPPYSGKRPG